MRLHETRTPLLLIASLLLPLTITAPASAGGDGAFRSLTVLTDAQEVQDPPVESDGIAKAIVTFDKGFTKLRVRVFFAHLEGEVTRLHFHCAVAGANGPIALGLIDLLSPANDNSDVVRLGKRTIVGTLTNENFPADEPPCADFIGRPVNNVASLAAAMEAGGIYWNLHTDAFPAGELRGQVRPFDDED